MLHLPKLGSLPSHVLRKLLCAELGEGPWTRRVTWIVVVCEIPGLRPFPGCLALAAPCPLLGGSEMGLWLPWFRPWVVIP